MAYHYEPGAVRWKRHNGKGDVRASRGPKGWELFAELRDTHPITGRPFKGDRIQWWIREKYTGEK